VIDQVDGGGKEGFDSLEASLVTQAKARWVLPVPGGPMRMTLFFG